MKLPNASSAYVDIAKLRDYSLNPAHGRGQHKTRVFLARLELTAIDAEELRDAILVAICECDAVPGEQDEHGQRFTLDFPMSKADDSGPNMLMTIKNPL